MAKNFECAEGVTIFKTDLHHRDKETIETIQRGIDEHCKTCDRVGSCGARKLSPKRVADSIRDGIEIDTMVALRAIDNSKPL